MSPFYAPEEATAIYERARPSDGPYSNATPINLGKREPYHLVDTDGRRYLDLHGQILSDSMGNGMVQKRVAEVVADLGGLQIVGPDFTHPELDKAQTNLAALLDEEFGGGPWSVNFKSSGTRANEDGIKYGRAFSGARMLPVFLREGYHGGGLMGAAIGHSFWRGSGTMPWGAPISFVDFGATPAFHEGNSGVEELERDYRKDFARLVNCILGQDGAPHLVEEWGVQGVAGFRRLHAPGVQEMSRLTHQRGGLVHADIVQTALGRTGAGLLAPRDLVDKTDPDTIPDIVAGAKALGVGQPFAFVAIRKAVRDQIPPAALGYDYDTYARNVPGATAFNVLHDLAKDPAFMDNINARADQLRKGLASLMSAHPMARSITGMGLMTGLKLDSAAHVTRFREAGLQNGLVCGVGGLDKGTLRFGFKLDTPPEIVEEALRKIDACLTAAER